MTLTEEKRAEYTELADYLQSSNQAAAEAIRALLADLEDETTRTSHYKDVAEQINSELELVRAEKDIVRGFVTERDGIIARMQTELAATRQQLARWKSNHEYVVKKLRLFTQRDDLPVDRLPAYQHVLELEKKLAEAQAGEARALADFDQLCESGPSLSSNDFELIRMTLETRPSDTSALQSAIAEAVEPYKRDAEQWRQQLAEAHAFIQSISDQLPEKPDHWSSCSQCQSNSASAEDFFGGAK